MEQQRNSPPPWVHTMPPKDDPDATSQPKPTQQQQPKPSGSRSAFSSITTVPAPVKRLFDKFPLVTYSANELPLRAPRERQRHQLYIFTTEDGALRGEASFNPSCLKWQVRRPPVRAEVAANSPEPRS